MYGQNQFYNPEPFIYRNKDYLRQFLCKPIVLILGILQAFSALTQLVTSIISANLSNTTKIALAQYLQSIFGDNISIETSNSISINLLPIVLAIAFFTIYFCAKKSNSDYKPGVTTFWVISIITLVIFIIAAVVLSLAIIVLLVSIPKMKQEFSIYYFYNNILPNTYNNDVTTGLTIAIILIFAILIIALTLILIYGISQFKFASSMRKSITTPYLFANGAKTYGVLHVIFSVFSCLGTIASVIGFFAVLFAADSFSRTIGVNLEKSTSISLAGLNMLSSVCAFAYNIYMAKFALGYNKHILAAGQGNYNQPSPAASYNAPPAQPYCQPPVQAAPQPFASVQGPAPVYSESGATTVLHPEQPATESTPPVYSESGATTVLKPKPEVEPTLSKESKPAADKEAVPAFCPECGTPVIPGQAFCSECGTKTV